MNSYTLSAPTLFNGEEWLAHQVISIENGVISAIEPNNQKQTGENHLHFEDGFLTASFIDLQVNGGGGVLFNDEPNLEGIRTILSAHQKLGTGAILPTLITADDATMINALAAAAEAQASNLEGVLGIHLEGPMLNPKKRGIHNSALFRTLSQTMLNALTTHNYGKVLLTVAPEMIDLSLLLELTNHGIYLFAGHTEASPDTLAEAINYGLHGFTHLYNAMPQMSSRDPNTTGFALVDENSYASIIGDGLHIDPLMLLLATRTKPKGKLFFVSDSMRTTGSNMTQFQLDQRTIYLKEGHLVDEQNTLAGAHLSMADNVANALKFGIDLPLALNMASRYPAEALNINQLGRIEVGRRAMINHITLDPFKVTPIYPSNIKEYL